MRKWCLVLLAVWFSLVAVLDNECFFPKNSKKYHGSAYDYALKRSLGMEEGSIAYEQVSVLGHFDQGTAYEMLLQDDWGNRIKLYYAPDSPDSDEARAMLANAKNTETRTSVSVDRRNLAYAWVTDRLYTPSGIELEPRYYDDRTGILYVYYSPRYDHGEGLGTRVTLRSITWKYKECWYTLTTQPYTLTTPPYADQLRLGEFVGKTYEIYAKLVDLDQSPEAIAQIKKGLDYGGVEYLGLLDQMLQMTVLLIFTAVLPAACWVGSLVKERKKLVYIRRLVSGEKASSEAAE